jgi:hypothetical protein
VSEKHVETNLHITAAAASLSTTVISPPHFGQSQDDTVGAISVDRITGAIFRRWRQKSSDKDRWYLAMKPKYHMRTKSLGNTCRRNRRMNLEAESVIKRCLLARA